MARSLLTTIRLLLKAALSNGNASLNAGASTISIPLTSGTGANQADVIYEKVGRTLAATTAETWDVYGGLTNDLNETVNCKRMKFLKIHNKSTDPSCVLRVGGAANCISTIFADVSDKILIRPGGILILVAPDVTGYVVTAATADILQVENLGSAIATYDLQFGGASV